jgi:hypothetical protein
LFTIEEEKAEIRSKKSSTQEDLEEEEEKSKKKKNEWQAFHPHEILISQW